MFQLNIAGVEALYGEGEVKHFWERRYHYAPAHGSEIQVVKSLQCWLSQCNEGAVVKKPLYRFFCDVAAPYLLSDIVCDLPDYEAACWG